MNGIGSSMLVATTNMVSSIVKSVQSWQQCAGLDGAVITVTKPLDKGGARC